MLDSSGVDLSSSCLPPRNSDLCGFETGGKALVLLLGADEFPFESIDVQLYSVFEYFCRLYPFVQPSPRS